MAYFLKKQGRYKEVVGLYIGGKFPIEESLGEVASLITLMMCLKMKCQWLKNESNYFVTCCKYLRLILQPLQTVIYKGKYI